MHCTILSLPYVFLLVQRICAVPHHGDLETLNVKRQTDSAIVSQNLETLATSFPAMVNALEVMQSEFWNGTIWPLGIDWTESTFNTVEWATLSIMARYGGESVSNLVDKYYSQILKFFEGEDVASIEAEKFDDMQWAVLEWLEAIKFLKVYDQTTAGNQYITEFANRSRIFWDLASQGWNTTLCGGGMVWTYSLLPYKNAVTNELFVATSVGMYLYFPGDNTTVPPVPAHDPKYLNAAIEAYDWLSSSNMTNSQGLYCDGFHIAGYVNETDIGTGQCNQLDEALYTYNQGIILSGLRGLWDATGQESYLDDGHTLVGNVIAATGWISADQLNETWSGLGSSGILQDVCDVTSSCSQDNQNFKGVFFHHFTAFCEPLAVGEQDGIIFKGTLAQAEAHQAKCNSYLDWILHNAQAAYGTRNASGVYGGWWDVPAVDAHCSAPPQQPAGSANVWNNGIPQNSIWRLPNNPPVSEAGMIGTAPDNGCPPNTTDPNSLGRGRTPETQTGGLAVMGCLVQAEESR